jgi:hypothetical protein
LYSLGVVDLANLGAIIFHPFDHKPCFPYHINFHIVVVYDMKSLTWNIFHMVVDEGASTCIMSLACWNSIVEPDLSLYPTFFTAFYDHLFRSHGIIFPMQLKGKIMCFEVEVVDMPLD